MTEGGLDGGYSATAIRPRLLDLFCGAGGAAMGYHRAGFDVVGVDISPQPRYPFYFIQADALEWLTDERLRLYRIDAIHASPPCKVHTRLRVIWGDRGHLNLIPPTRERLDNQAAPYVIENVMPAPVRRDVVLCGTMFNLRLADGRGHLERHRAFEFGNGWPVPLVSPCHHPRGSRAVGVYGHTGGSGTRSGYHGWVAADWREVMGIDWMTRDELAQAIPPAYTEHIGAELLRQVRRAEPVGCLVNDEGRGR